MTFEAGPFTYFGFSALKPPVLASKILLGSSLGNSSNTALNNLVQARKQSLNISSRPPSPDASLALENQPLTIVPSPSIPSSPENVSILRSPSGTSEMLSGRAGSISQLQPPADNSSSFIPDFTVKPIENTLYMKIPRKVYLAAFRASLMDRKDEFLESDFELFKQEIDNIIESNLANNKIIGYNQSIQNKLMSKSASDVPKERKLEQFTSISNATTKPPLKRRSSIIESINVGLKTIGLQSPSSPKTQNPKKLERLVKHQSVPSPSTLPANSSSSNLSNSSANNVNTALNVISNPAQLTDVVIVQKDRTLKDRNRF